MVKNSNWRFTNVAEELNLDLPRNNSSLRSGWMLNLWLPDYKPGRHPDCSARTPPIKAIIEIVNNAPILPRADIIVFDLFSNKSSSLHTMLYHQWGLLCCLDLLSRVMRYEIMSLIQMLSTKMCFWFVWTCNILLLYAPVMTLPAIQTGTVLVIYRFIGDWQVSWIPNFQFLAKSQMARRKKNMIATKIDMKVSDVASIPG